MRCDLSISRQERQSILPYRLVDGSHLDRGQREYGWSVDQDRAVGVNPSTALLFSSLSPYHLASVIDLGCADEAHEGNRILSLKLSERVSPCFSQVLFFFLGRVSFFKTPLVTSEREHDRLKNP